MSRRTGARPFNCDDQAKATWIERADRCVDLVEAAIAGLAAPAGPAAPAGQPRPIRLADLGCGDQKLRERLALRKTPVEYHGFDLMPQSPDVARYDITADPPPGGFDIFTILGVVEYLTDVKAALTLLRAACRHLVVCHVVSNRNSYRPQDLERLGWVTHLSEEAFADLLRQSGFAIERTAITLEGRIVLWLARSAAGQPGR